MQILRKRLSWLVHRIEGKSACAARPVAPRLPTMFRMRRPFRAVLCVVLVVWQAALAPLAHAAVFHAPVNSREAAQAQLVMAAAGESAPCHGEAVPARSAGEGHEAHHVSASLPEVLVANHDEPADCCQSLACQCACMHATALSTLGWALAVVPDHASELVPLTPKLALPARELFRPPI